MPSTEGAAVATIVVCLKWVPTRPEIDPLSGSVHTDDRFSGISPADKAALEWALRVAESRNMAVRAITVGPEAAEAGLVEAVIHGASGAVRLADDADTQRSSRQVATALAAIAERAQLVFCGDHSLDRGSGAVPGFLAHQLGYGQVLGCVGLRIDPDGGDTVTRGSSLVAERRLDQGRRELLAVDGPTVISFEGGLELRRAPLAATMAAPSAVIEVLQPAARAEVEPDQPRVVRTGPYRPRARVLSPPMGSTRERVQQLTGVGEERPSSQQLELSPAEAADTAIEQLRAWGYLETDRDPNESENSDGNSDEAGAR